MNKIKPADTAAMLRAAVAKLRVKPMPLADMIPLMQQAADIIARQETALRKAGAHIVWHRFGSCRSFGYEGPPPTASEAYEAIKDALGGEE